jgi:hypothetical protein
MQLQPFFWLKIMRNAVPQQDAIKVFANEAGSISIQQENGMDGISTVCIHPAYLNALIRALREAKQDVQGIV